MASLQFAACRATFSQLALRGSGRVAAARVGNRLAQRSAASHVFRVELVDAVFVGLAGVILVGVGLLQKSLGDVAADEAQLPPVTGARAKRELNRSSRFLNRPPKRK